MLLEKQDLINTHSYSSIFVECLAFNILNPAVFVFVLGFFVRLKNKMIFIFGDIRN